MWDSIKWSLEVSNSSALNDAVFQSAPYKVILSNIRPSRDTRSPPRSRLSLLLLTVNIFSVLLLLLLLFVWPGSSLTLTDYREYKVEKLQLRAPGDNSQILSPSVSQLQTLSRARMQSASVRYYYLLQSKSLIWKEGFHYTLNAGEY